MANGMSAYLTRDDRGDYMFLMQTVMKSTVDAVRSVREKELAKKIREEVESVRRLQQSVLPKNISPPDGYRICARFEPANLRVAGGQPVAMAGGDYYDIYPIADDKLVLLIGDATGHGMKACLSIMSMHTLVRIMRRPEFTDTAYFVTEINKGLCEQSIVNQKGGFITLLYTILEPSTRTLYWSSAGHQPPLLQNLSTGMIEALAGEDAGGLPLAVDEDAEYESYTCILPENSRLLLYTDGLDEAFPDEDESNHFGIVGIKQTLTECASLSIQETLERLFEVSDHFTKGSGRQDDTSIVLLEHRIQS
jgi:serine phosphatase RsbU (regulator of sigma subunit)